MASTETGASDLAAHTIHKVNTYKIRTRFPRLIGKNAFRDEHGYGDEVLVKELLTDRGASGWGLASGLFYRPDLTEDELVLGRTVAELFAPDQGILDMSLSSFDFALHDLAGRILGIPCYKMFGNDGLNPVPVYDTLIYFDDISPDTRPGGLRQVLENCRYGYDYGYRAFKLKIGRAPRWMDWPDGLRRDIEVTRMVREHFPDCEILVDANDAYTVDRMKEYVDAVADVGLYWIEEPFRENLEGFRALREHLDRVSPRTLIADGETDPEVELLIELYEQGYLGVFQMDVQGDLGLGHAFGLTSWRRLMPRLREIGARISPHAWGIKLKTHYAAQFCAGYPGVALVEGITDTTEGVDFSAYVLRNGKMFVPDKPGFGMELVWGAPVTGEGESKTVSRQV
ncbi:mandelate racemase/muconate lactonizing enzyme family protein [Leucobacter sp. wl10]|uniref:mandelate racemase/muconate lactonizing enzyme family protein n=1 Tax=Leucobacter sp. wl10 TaxID=2304677 RepID=UPI000E5BE55C|nr:enolase C-terminal domain-like protein [Leucobacter sp. wl10]RGE22026.1 mandelate racemase [Leucobacter sp. wl10]